MLGAKPSLEVTYLTQVQNSVRVPDERILDNAERKTDKVPP